MLDSIEAISERAELLLDKLATLSPSTQETETPSEEATTIHASLQVIAGMHAIFSVEFANQYLLCLQCVIVVCRNCVQ